MAYRYRVTLLAVSRHPDPVVQRVKLELQDLELGTRWHRWFDQAHPVHPLTFRRLPRAHHILSGYATLRVATAVPGLLVEDHLLLPPYARDTEWRPHPGGRATSPVGYLAIGESFLLWTEETPGPAGA